MIHEAVTSGGGVPRVLETACRRPRALRHALPLALMHKNLHEYVRETSRRLDDLLRDLEDSEPAA